MKKKSSKTPFCTECPHVKDSGPLVRTSVGIFPVGVKNLEGSSKKPCETCEYREMRRHLLAEAEKMIAA